MIQQSKLSCVHEYIFKVIMIMIMDAGVTFFLASSDSSTSVLFVKFCWYCLDIFQNALT